MKTTLNKIRKHSPCAGGWTKLLAHLGKTKADDEPLSIATILDSNGLGDALWCLRAVEGHAREIRLYAVWCARQVQHLMTDPRSTAALDVAERFANGKATDEELAAARAAAAEARSDAWGDASAVWADAAARRRQRRRRRRQRMWRRRRRCGRMRRRGPQREKPKPNACEKCVRKLKQGGGRYEQG